MCRCVRCFTKIAAPVQFFCGECMPIVDRFNSIGTDGVCWHCAEFLTVPNSNYCEHCGERLVETKHTPADDDVLAAVSEDVHAVEVGCPGDTQPYTPIPPLFPRPGQRPNRTAL